MPKTNKPAGPRLRRQEIRRVNLNQIYDNPQNHRRHNRQQQQGLDAIVEELGWYGYPDVFPHPDRPNAYMLVDGEMRKHHLIRRHGERAAIDVNVIDFTRDEARKALATKDALASMAGTEQAKLDELLGAIDAENEAFAAFMREFQPIDYTDDDELEETPTPDPSQELDEKWAVQPGDLYRISGQAEHFILCGDATDAEQVARLWNQRPKPFLMVTDPFYGVEYRPSWRNKALSGSATKRTGEVQNDDRCDWREAWELFPGRVAYIWHAGRYVGEVLASLEAAKFRMRNQIIWRKPSLVISRGHYHWQHEPCIYATRKGTPKWQGDMGQSSVWEISNRVAKTEGQTIHGTQKPLECMGRPIRNHGTARDPIYDPFLGSGTTAIAAERLARPSYGLELDPIYMAVILERFSQEPGISIDRVDS